MERRSTLAGKLLKTALCAVLVLNLLQSAPLFQPPEAFGNTGTATCAFTGTTVHVENTDGSNTSFAEGIMYVDGTPAICVNYAIPFQPGGVHSIDALEYFGSQEIVTIIALVDHFIFKAEDGPSTKGYSYEQLYYAQQLATWAYLGTFYNWGIQSVHTSGGIGFIDVDEWYSVLWPSIAGFVNANKSLAKGQGTVWLSNTGGQQLLTSATVDLHGRIELQKSSSDPALTDGNTSYSLSGAEFDVYRDGIVHAGVLRTDANGYALSSDLPVGTYALIEKTAPQGYRIDKTPYWATVIAGQTTRVNPDKGSVPNAPETGSIDLQKASSDASITENSAGYSLKGALYGIFADAGCTQQVTAIETDGNGYAKSGSLGLGQYFIKELRAPSGYALDTKAYPVTVKPGQTARVNASTVHDAPQGNPIGIVLRKIDGDLGYASPQGGGSLEDAHFKIDYYRGFYATAAEAEAAGNPSRSWTVRTDSDGSALLDQAHLVSGDEFYTFGGRIGFPLGTVTIAEVKAPQGYRLDDGAGGRPPTACIPIRSDGSNAEIIDFFVAPDIADVVKRGDIRIVKEVPTNLDPENQATTRIVVEGVRFHVINDNEHAVLSPDTGKAVAPGDVVTTMVTDENGFASTKGKQLPSQWTGALAYGTYLIHEVIPQDVFDRYKREYGISMLPIDDFKMSIAEEGQYHIPTLVSNNIPQTPLMIVKVDAASGKRIPLECAFALFDGAGNRLTYTDRLSGQVLDTWRTGKDGVVTLPMKLAEGTYRIVEIEAPYGYVLDQGGVEFTVDEYRTWENPFVVEYANTPIIGCIEIAKSDSSNGGAVEGAEYSLRAAADIVTGDGTVHARENELIASGIITDGHGIARIENLHLGRYKLYETKAPQGYALDTKEHLVEIESQGQDTPVVFVRQELGNAPTSLIIKKTDQFTGLVLEGAEYRLWQDGGTEDGDLPFERFATTDANGEARFTYLVPGTYKVIEVKAPTGYLLPEGLEPVVVTVDDQGQIEGTHTIVLEQTNRRIEIDSLATDGEGGGKSIIAQPDAAIVDALTFEHLDPGTEYTVFGMLMDKETGNPLTVNGEHVCARSTFTPDSPEGHVDVRFTFDATGLGPSSLVVFESIYDGESLVGEHSDLDDEDQTVEVIPPSIGTSATDLSDGDKSLSAEPKATIVDSVYYANLVAGTEYTVEGMLMSRATNEPLIQDGVPVVSSAAFTAEEEGGTVEVFFTFDASALAGTSLVAFERLFKDGVEIASHADIEDVGQTVEVIAPSIGTWAKNKEFGDKVAVASDEVHIVDTVFYTGLTPGAEYSLEGVLMDRSTGDPVISHGTVVAANRTFTAEQGDGALDIEFSFDAQLLAGTAVVAFEWLYKEGILIAAHTDITDEGQTVRIDGQAIHTFASESGTGAKRIANSAEARITDAVAYENLIIGKRYTMKGVLIDRATGLPLEIGGGQVKSEASFTPTNAKGSIDLEFAFDARNLSEASVVVFETLYCDGIEITSHRDVSDDNQTVWISALPQGSTYGKTGIGLAEVAPIIIGCGLALGLTALARYVYLARKRRKARWHAQVNSIKRMP